MEEQLVMYAALTPGVFKSMLFLYVFVRFPDIFWEMSTYLWPSGLGGMNVMLHRATQ